MVRLYPVLLLFFSAGNLFAQVTNDSSRAAPIDSAVTIKAPPKKDSQKKQPVFKDTIDTISVTPALDSAWKTRINPLLAKSFETLVFKEHPFYSFSSGAFVVKSDIKEFRGKELMFYVLIGLFLLFAFLRTIFPKYLNDLFRLFFRRTLKQRQITEQLSQTPLPSLVLNTFFIITAGLYLGFILQHFSLGHTGNFWLLSLYSSGGLAAMYLLKFLTLKFTGWVLNLSAATDSYIFIVFIINKVIGIFLLPFLVLLAFSQGDLYQIAITLSWCGIACLLVYRFILSYSAMHNQIKVKPFHFIIYLFAFEIVPLLLIYKLLFYFLF